MADSTIATMTGASTLDGTELYYGVQGGADRKVTGAQIKTLAQGGAALISGTPTAGQLATWVDATHVQGVTALNLSLNAKTGSFTATSTMQGQLVQITSGSAVALTQPQAGVTFPSGWSVTYENLGAGTVTITPTTSTINGAASITLAQYDAVLVVSDGTNYQAIYNKASAGGGGGTPGGSNGQLQYNNSSAFGGISGSSVSANGSLALGGATVTTSDPVLALTQTWNGAAVVFKGISLNVTKTAASTLSGLIDLSIGGSTYFRAGENAVGWGAAWVGAGITPSATNYTLMVSSGSLNINSALNNGTISFYFADNQLGLRIAPNASGAGVPNVVMGGVLATNATDGFFYINSGAGTPTGTPSTFTGRVPLYVDTTNAQLWMYLGGAWKQPKTPSAAALVTWQ